MRIISILAILFIISCSSYNNNEIVFLNGSWIRVNNASGLKTFENWEIHKNGSLKGLGFTLQNLDTVFKENLRIVKLNGVWNYEVKGVNPEPTYFKFTQQTDSSFVCENPDNEFPKKIKYILTNDTLKAYISDYTNSISFHFIKNNN